MLRSFLNNKRVDAVKGVVFLVVALFGSFYFASQLFSDTIWLMRENKIPIDAINENVLASIVAVLSYSTTIFIFIKILGYVAPELTKKETGMSRQVTWSDIFITPVAFVLYFVLSAILLFLFARFLPGVDLNQGQSVGFGNINTSFEMILAFLTLIIMAPIAEEVLFRGYLLGAMKQKVGNVASVIIVSLVFAFAHGSVNVGIDTFALSVLLCTVRLTSGSIWPSILLHAAKNSLAFYLLFINPTFLTTIGG